MDKQKSPGRPGDFLCSGAGESPAGDFSIALCDIL